MSQLAFRRARRIRLISAGRVRYLSSQCHECVMCWATWNPLEHGELCPHGCQDEGGAA